MIQYNFKQLDEYNHPISIPDQPKYQSLIEFLKQFKMDGPTSINRTFFGQNAPKHYFKIATTVDDVIKTKINELMSKITEDNQEQLIEEFKRVSFEQVKNYQMITTTLHNGIIQCYKYHRQFIPLIDHINKVNNNFEPMLKKVFLDYKNQIDKLVELEDEAKFISKKQILVNYEMIILMYLKKIIFEYSDIQSEIDNLLSRADANSIEILIRLLTQLKSSQIPINLEIIKQINQIIKINKFPRMFNFLMMDLE